MRKLRDESDIVLYPDGKYRWLYEMNMIKNPILLICLLRLFGVSAVLLWFFMGLFRGFKGFLDFSIYYVRFAAFFLVVIVICFYIYALLMGGKYCVLFIMDEKEIVHAQQKKKAEKKELMKELTTMLNVVAGNVPKNALEEITDKTSVQTVFSDVKRVKADKKLGLIRLIGTNGTNQIYVSKEDYDFVYDFINVAVNGGNRVE